MTEPGWYSEPGNAERERYWDGAQWTPQTRPVEAAAETPDSVKPGRRRKWLVPTIVAAVLVVAAAIVVPLVVLSGSSSQPLAGYGQDPVVVAKHLKSCTSVKRFGKSVARCTNADGDNVGILTEDDETSQEFGVALLKDRSAGDCAVIIKGVIFSASTEGALTEVLGVPEQFASNNNGYVLCPIH
jgi:hypothetical protein